MKISYIFPGTGVNTGNKNYQWWLYKELKVLGHEVLENECEVDCDAILCMTLSQANTLSRIHGKFPNIPIYYYHHDWFPFLAPNPSYIETLRKCKEVWVNSKDTQRLTKKDFNIESVVIHPLIVPEEWEDIEVKDGGYALMASRRDWYKRFDWFEKACEELRIPFRSFHPAVHARRDFLNGMAQSSICVSTSLYEGFGLTPAEAAYLGKPLVLTDIPVFKELWEGRAYFFKSYDYEDFKKGLKKAFKEKKFTNNRKYVEDNFTPQKMAQKVTERLTYHSVDRRSV